MEFLMHLIWIISTWAPFYEEVISSIIFAYFLIYSSKDLISIVLEMVQAHNILPQPNIPSNNYLLSAWNQCYYAHISLGLIKIVLITKAI